MITDANDFVRDPRSSSGPRTEEGLESPSGARAKARSSRNSLKFGLFTAHDFIRERGFQARRLNTVEKRFRTELRGAGW